MKLNLLLVLFSTLYGQVLASTEAEEIAQNSISVQFYQLSKKKWNDKSSSFRDVVASTANEECAGDYLKCGLTRWNSTTTEFSSSNVVISGTSDEIKNYLLITFYLTFNSVTPSSARNITSFVVNKEALSDISTRAREDLNDAVGEYIVQIAGEAFSPPPNKYYNTIMIPIAFTLLLGVIIAAISCYCYRRSVLRKESRARFGQKRKKKAAKKKRDVEGSPKAKVGPAPRTEEASSNGRPKTAKDRFRDGADIQYGVYDECEMPDVTSRAHALPPLTTADEYETDAEARKRKKKSKKSKKKSKSKEILQTTTIKKTSNSGDNLSNTASTEL